MENLCSRLDVLQEQQMELIDKDSGCLKDIISYYALLRREAVLLFAANVRDIKKVGLTVVPPKQVCEANAKQAIEMHLVLCSLSESTYGQEPWYLAQVSHDMYMLRPTGTFKKNGKRVLVTFDGDESNLMEYMCWEAVYKQRQNGQWSCVKSIVSHEGIYYDCEGYRDMYVDFAREAAKYGNGGEWSVQCDGQGITDCALVSSTSTPSTLDTSLDASLGNTLLSPGPGRNKQTPKAKGRRGRKRKLDPAEPDGVRFGPPPSPPPSPKPAPVPPPSPPSPPPTPPEPPGGSGGSLNSTGTTDPGSCTGNSDTCGGPSDSDCDNWGSKRPGTCPDIPTLLISGGPNQVKCLRYRLRRHHRKAYRSCSTTWSWIGDDLQDHTEHRICLSFYSEAQRVNFQKTVRLPKGVRVGSVNLPF
ncbi:E2 protein [Omikronpapillomavirus 1]|uniref:Regulatory protein E2 n=1 Tax=Phocoena spinipinnis papillomavirus (isolate Burmeister's porpoise/Peru/PsPV1) TaxID=654916 RepID=Q8UZ17_PSPVP|nr:E2 protein [Omikronpapillomavirus 1]CAC80271.1 E2 protein [Omikronpapillomavirus 1]